jgi:hypothetical protein
VVPFSGNLLKEKKTQFSFAMNLSNKICVNETAKNRETVTAGVEQKRCLMRKDALLTSRKRRA